MQLRDQPAPDTAKLALIMQKHSRPQSNFFLTAHENRTQRISGLWAAIEPETLVTRILHFDVAHNSSVTKKN